MSYELLFYAGSAIVSAATAYGSLKARISSVEVAVQSNTQTMEDLRATVNSLRQDLDTLRLLRPSPPVRPN